MTEIAGVELDTTRLDSLPDEVRRRAEEILEIAARQVEAAAKAEAPVDTNFLRDSFKVREKPLRRIIRATAEYAAYVEFGTSRQAAQPYFTPAIEAVRKPLMAAWKTLIK